MNLVGLCSHIRAVDFFAASINDNRFYAQKCSSFDEINRGRCTVVSSGYLMGGEPLDYNASGVFFLATNAVPPYPISEKPTILGILSKIFKL